jgi:hypothetical protein
MATMIRPVPRTEDLLIGILAVLALHGKETLRTTDKVFHRAFGDALEVFKRAEGPLKDLAEDYDPDVVTKTYDELNNALIAAEGFQLLRFPNPSYSRLQITMTPRVAESLLTKYPQQRQVFEAAAAVLCESIRG